MKDGFIKVAAGTVDVVVADVQYNTEQILARMREADAAGVNLLTLPGTFAPDGLHLRRSVFL